jgi:hypothetical protein
LPHVGSRLRAIPGRFHCFLHPRQVPAHCKRTTEFNEEKYIAASIARLRSDLMFTSFLTEASQQLHASCLPLCVKRKRGFL